MEPIRIDNYCFDRIKTWIQYDWRFPQFVEVVIEVFYPADRLANGLVMFNHGFLIGNDFLYYPKKIAGAFTDSNPLFGINPSRYYNYSSAIVEKNWAMAFISASHLQFEGVPWVDFGGNPRAGQDAYAAASYLIKYGATDYMFKGEEYAKGLKFSDREVIQQSRFMKSGCNNVIFAGHSVGGGHAQAAACGFETLQDLGKKSFRFFDPVMYDREFLPVYSERMSRWKPEERANPVGLLQLSPVDMKIPLLADGMEPYRKALAAKEMPVLMIVGECDCACLNPDKSKPPAWSSDAAATTQFSQLAPAGSNSWAVVANVARGSHCGYLMEENVICSQADTRKNCSRCPDKEVYKAGGDESCFTEALLKEFIAVVPDNRGFQGDRSDWIKSGCIQWLNKENPSGELKLLPFGDGYIDYAGREVSGKP
jgi:hypothetical protein